MGAVEEIGGIPGIERKGLEAREGLENGGRPLPAVADELRNPERTVSLRGGSDRNGIPVCEIKVSLLRRGRFVPPGIAALPALGRPKSGPMKLRFAGE